MLDLLIKNGRVVDGTGLPGFNADVAVERDRIVAVGRIEGSAKTTVDASGKSVTPGFIDLHTHSDGSFLLDAHADSKLRQGVTLELMGNCGMSFCAPLRGQAREALDEWLDRYGRPLNPTWVDMAGYLDALEQAGSTINLAAQVGHGTVRRGVLGMEARSPSADEQAQMEGLVEESLEQGALGFATGLFYAPGSYSLTDEVIGLAAVAARHGALYSSHLRSEGADGPGLFTAYQEAIEIGRRTGVRVQISHVKCKGIPVWGRAPDVLEMMERARREGIDVAGDQYPYTRSSTLLSAALLPKWALEGGREGILSRIRDERQRERVAAGIDANIKLYGSADAVLLSSFAPAPELEGKTLAEIASLTCDTPADAALGLYERAEGQAVLASLNQEDVDVIAAAPFIAVASDGNSLRTEGVLSRGKPHPRSYGTNARVFREFVREKKIMSVESAVHRMTGLPAERLQLTHRGRVAPGFAADLVIFDPQAVTDTATFAQPHSYAKGVEHVWVNGEHALDRGTPTQAIAGRVLRSTAD